MAFRKTEREFKATPVGQLRPYGKDYWIDVDNNVYAHDGMFYTKIGYDSKEWEYWSQTVPLVGEHLTWHNLFSPKERGKGEDAFGLAVFIYGMLVNILMMAGRYVMGKIYNLVTKRWAIQIAEWTEQHPHFRLYLPIAWFYDTTDDYMEECSVRTIGFLLGLALLPVTIILLTIFYWLNIHEVLFFEMLVYIIGFLSLTLMMDNVFYFIGNFIRVRERKLHRF